MIFLISEDILKEEGLIDENLFGGYLRPAIQLAQDKGLQTLIGGALYDKIIGLVEDGTITAEANAKYKELLDDYIIPYLMFQTLTEVAVPISWKFKNQGMVEANTDWTTRPSMKDFQYIVQKYENDAVFYGNRLTDYLKANCTTYPEYNKFINGKLFHNDKDYKVGLYLGYPGHRCGLRCNYPDEK